MRLFHTSSYNRVLSDAVAGFRDFYMKKERKPYFAAKLKSGTIDVRGSPPYRMTRLYF